MRSSVSRPMSNQEVKSICRSRSRPASVLSADRCFSSSARRSTRNLKPSGKVVSWVKQAHARRDRGLPQIDDGRRDGGAILGLPIGRDRRLDAGAVGAEIVGQQLQELQSAGGRRGRDRRARSRRRGRARRPRRRGWPGTPRCAGRGGGHPPPAGRAAARRRPPRRRAPRSRARPRAGCSWRDRRSRGRSGVGTVSAMRRLSPDGSAGPQPSADLIEFRYVEAGAPSPGADTPLPPRTGPRCARWFDCLRLRRWHCKASADRAETLATLH